MRDGDAASMASWRRGFVGQRGHHAPRRPLPAGTPRDAAAGDTVRIRFAGGVVEANSRRRPPPGVYDVRTTGGTSVLVVNASREWVPRAASVRDGALSRGGLSTDAPRLSDRWWPFVAALLLLCAEWIVRRFVGLR